MLEFVKENGNFVIAVKRIPFRVERAYVCSTRVVGGDFFRLRY